MEKVQYISRIVRAGGCPAVVAQWQSTGGSSQSCPGSTPGDCQLFHFPLFSSHNMDYQTLAYLSYSFYVCWISVCAQQERFLSVRVSINTSSIIN